LLESSTTGSGAYYGCAVEGSVPQGTKLCDVDYCNCPANVHKTLQALGWTFGDMRNIMYPVMGIVFSIIWLALAFIGGGPVDIILLIVSLIDAVFGIFLIFLPVTTYLGLFYVAIGAFTIASVRHSFGGKIGVYILIGLTIVIFLLTGGLTVVANNTNAVDDIAANTVSFTSSDCESDMNIDNWENSYQNLNTRCENWALFLAFCVFFLFLSQPIAILELFFKKSGGGSGVGGHPSGQPSSHNTNDTAKSPQ